MNESGSIAETIFMGARQLPPPQRTAYLDEKCSHDPALRERVERLLQAEQKADRFLANNPLELDGSPPVRNELTGKEGSILGKYKLLQQIGEGGCGVVYMAEQEQPMRRRVALKLIKPGMDTRQVIARFEAERQALAMMDHPNIARVLDAGATETGHPYFVMELVRGIRITEYCDQNNLSTRDRLELFTQVAQAVQHAHQKGIIHRDLKPSNVLVTLHDGVPVPKVIDFGIAKAIAQKLTDKTLFTQFEQFIGTPAYTSPEQAEMSGPDIDTRSDIYSLGVLLYELMVGRTPFDTKELLQSGLEEMRRIIREKEPNRPSTLLSTMLAEERTSTAQRRAASPPELIHVLRGDLDWIVMKCLEKDRTRRYETASGLAADIQHYLSNEPVVARPPSTAYRFNKLVRRNKLAFTAGAAVAVALVAGIIASTWQAARARRAERAAQEERDSAEAVLMFFRDKVLAAGRPEGQQGGLGKDVTLRQAIDTAEAEISRSFTNRPLVEAAIRMTIGESYRYLGELGLASEQLEQAFALYRDTLGLDHGVTVSALDALQQAYKDSGTPSRSLLLYEELFKSRKAKLGLEHDDTLTAMNNLGLAHMYLGHHDQARPLLEETLRIRKAKLEPGHVSTLATMHNLAALYWALGQTAPGLALYEETLELKRAKLGSDHDDTQLTMRNLVGVYLRAGKSEQAVALAEELYALAKSKRGPEHPDTLRNHSELSYTYSRVGMPEQAVSHYEELLRIRKARLGPEHPDTLTSMNNLGLAYSEAGKSDQAVPLLEETLRLRRIKLGREHPGTLSTLNNLALAYEDLGKLDRAVVLLEEALELYRANLGSEHHETLNTMNNLAVIYGKAGKPDQGLALAQEVVDLTKARWGPEHPDTLRRMNELGGALDRAGKHDQAVSLLEKTLESQTAKLGPEHPDTRSTAARLGGACLGAKKYDLALPLLQKAFQELKTRNGPNAFSTLRMMHSLAMATEFAASGTLERAMPLYEEALERMKATGHEDTPVALTGLAGVYLDAGELDRAEALLREGLTLSSDSQRCPLGLARVLLDKARNGTNDPAIARARLAEGEQLVRDTLAKARIRYANDPVTLERCLNDAAEAYYRGGNYAAAEPLLRKSMQSERARLDAEHQNVSGAPASLARLLADWAWSERETPSELRIPESKLPERAREAERLLRECLGILLRRTNAIPWQVDDMKSRLGGALVSVVVTDAELDPAARQAKLAEAETLLLEGNQRLQESQAAWHIAKRDALERVVRLYEAANKPDERAEWQQTLEGFSKRMAPSALVTRSE